MKYLYLDKSGDLGFDFVTKTLQVFCGGNPCHPRNRAENGVKHRFGLGLIFGQ